LTEALNTSGHEDEICGSSTILRHRVGTEEGYDPLPKADRRFGFVALPAVVDFAKDPYLGGGLALGMAGEETVISPVSPREVAGARSAFAGRAMRG
jgi:hypothetical protein